MPGIFLENGERNPNPSLLMAPQCPPTFPSFQPSTYCHSFIDIPITLTCFLFSSFIFISPITTVITSTSENTFDPRSLLSIKTFFFPYYFGIFLPHMLLIINTGPSSASALYAQKTVFLIPRRRAKQAGASRLCLVFCDGTSAG